MRINIDLHTITSLWKRRMTAFAAKRARTRMAGMALLTAIACATTTGCSDDDALQAGPDGRGLRATTSLTATNPGGLIQDESTREWTASCRVPIVGPGRIVNEINSGGLLTVAGGSNSVENLVDADLTNGMTLGSIAAAGLVYTPVASVRDLYHTYASGQKVGFVIKANSSSSSGTAASLLSVTALQSFVIQLKKDGEVAGTYLLTEENATTLGLDLITFANSDNNSEQIIAIDADAAFDEVRLCYVGADVAALSGLNMEVKYAFVGENREIPAVEGESFWTTTPTVNDDRTGPILGVYSGGSFTQGNWVNSVSNLTDSDTENYISFGSLQNIANHAATVNFHQQIPAGYEVGYKYSTAKLLGLGLLNTQGPSLQAYNSNTATADKYESAADVLSLSLIGGGSTYTSICLTEPCTQLRVLWSGSLGNALNELTGGANLYYAYVREPVSLDPTNYFTIGDDETYSSSYRLPTPESGTVQYVLLSSPGGASARISNNVITGMTVNGDYVVQALYTDNATGKDVVQTATITKIAADVVEEGCNNYITTTTFPNAQITGAYDSEGTLISLSGISNVGNIIDGDTENYATYVGALTTLEFRALAAIDINETLPTETGATRVGFEIQPETGLLDLSVLGYYQVKVYSNGTELTNLSTISGDAVDAGVLNTCNSRTRLSVTVPEGQTFDHIELWKKGFATALTTQRIYNAFYEKATCQEAGVAETCLDVMTAAKNNLMIDYSSINVNGLVTIDLSTGGGLSDLANLLDGDLDTYAQFGTGSVSLLSDKKLSLKFTTQAAGQPIGLVVGQGSSLIGLDAFKNTTLTVYNDGEAVGSEDASLETLGASILEYSNGKIYIEVTPTAEYDQIVYNFSSVLGTSLGEGTLIYGVYTRTDSDGDGVPDCADDVTSGTLVMSTATNHVCLGDPVELRISADSQEDAETFTLKYTSTTGDTYSGTGKVITTSDNDKYIEDDDNLDLPSGQYYVDILSEDETVLHCTNIVLQIHPAQTTWKTGAESSDWNKWDNWTNGSPWTCTDVILPQGATLYPELSAGETNYCQNIHFEPGAELVNTPALTYSGKVFVDMALTGGTYHAVSAPITGMVTGDMFVSNGTSWGKSNYFTQPNSTNYPERRVSPIVYQRFWSKTVQNQTLDSDATVSAAETNWSGSFNVLTTAYETGQGFSIRLGKESTTDDQTYVLHFPKAHTTYHYYYANGTASSKMATITRSGDGIFVADELPYTLTLSNEAASDYFLLGNPFMCHIDLAKLLSGNSGIASLAVYDGTNYNTITLGEDGSLVSTGSTLTKLAPMSAIWVAPASESGATSLSVNITSDMVCQASSSNLTASVSRKTKSVSATSQLKLTASADGNDAACLVMQSGTASDAFRPGEDAAWLVDNEVRPAVGVFTLAGKKAAAIQEINTATRIPVGFYMKRSGSVTLTFSTKGNTWSGWKLVDSITGKKYDLSGSVKLSDVKSGTSRFYLEKVF